MCKFASTLASTLARMALVWSKVLALLLLLQLARPISGLRFTVGAHLCAKRAAQPSASWRSPPGCRSSGGCSERPSTPEAMPELTPKPGANRLSLSLLHATPRRPCRVLCGGRHMATRHRGAGARRARGRHRALRRAAGPRRRGDRSGRRGALHPTLGRAALPRRRPCRVSRGGRPVGRRHVERL